MYINEFATSNFFNAEQHQGYTSYYPHEGYVVLTQDGLHNIDTINVYHEENVFMVFKSDGNKTYKANENFTMMVYRRKLELVGTI